MEPKYIRNFSIIAHIDHGKSTLADRMLENTHTVSKREIREQMLDDMDIEREKGITIKAKAVRLKYIHNKTEYELNLIDTPGHVDFSYEVSRSLAACEGVLLVIDAVQGVQAQTIANLYLAVDNNLKIIPVINKIDLPGADIEMVSGQIGALGLETDDIICTSAKTGEGIEEVFKSIIEKIPPPVTNLNSPLKCLIFDSHYNSYKGVICYFKVKDGFIEKNMMIKFMSNNQNYEVTEVGFFKPGMQSVEQLTAGEVGYCIAGIKHLKDVKIGDTITSLNNSADKPLPGYKEMKPVVFCDIYPVDAADYKDLRYSIERLQLNDSSFTFVPQNSLALGNGFKCGFLGLLHLEIFQERLDREFEMSTVTTQPSVSYKIINTDGLQMEVNSTAEMPSNSEIAKILEPYIRATILVKEEYIGNVMKISEDYRGTYKRMEYLDTTTVILEYDMPLSEVVIDFYDKLKSVTQGYGSFDYEMTGYMESDLVRMNILINGRVVDALSCIVFKGNAFKHGKAILKKIKDILPRRQFAIPLQAAIDSRIIARETIKAYRKDVTAKLYGGDITRKRKVLEKQKKGKKKMKRIGEVDIPQELFVSVMKR